MWSYTYKAYHKEIYGDAHALKFAQACSGKYLSASLAKELYQIISDLSMSDLPRWSETPMETQPWRTIEYLILWDRRTYHPSALATVEMFFANPEYIKTIEHALAVTALLKKCPKQYFNTFEKVSKT